MSDKSNFSCTNFKNLPLIPSLEESVAAIKKICGETSDLLVNEVEISGISCALIVFEGMISTSTITQLILHPLMYLELEEPSSEVLFGHIRDRMLLTVDRSLPTEYGDLIRFLMSGFAILLIDGCPTAFAFGVQGYDKRSISEPNGEGNVKGAHEGFVEVVRTNMSLVRRRMKSPALQFRLFPIGQKSRTDVIICYMADRVPEKLIRRLKSRLLNIELESILGSGYIEPFIDKTKCSFFSGVSTTERPDVMCAKLIEGRIGLLIEGTPYAVVIPYLFIENFQTLDDYNSRPYYAVFIRYIKYLAFFLSVFLPSLYVSVATFHPEMLNLSMLIRLSSEEQKAPMPLMFETILVLLYEIIREAGLRLPQNVGGAVSIVGGLIIGDAAVKSGLISTPMLITVALSVTASFVVPNLNQQITILRLIFVIAGGISGLFGMALLTAPLIVNICSVECFGAPIMSPLSPFTSSAMGDVLTRLGFRRMGTRNVTVENLNGVDME